MAVTRFFITMTLMAGAFVTSTSPIAIHEQRRSANIKTPTTLQSAQLWIRPVEAPNFHKCLRTKPTSEPVTANFDSSTEVGQFNIVDGQLVNRIASPPFYMQPSQPSDPSSPPRILAICFSTTKNTPEFAFQGDAVTWSVASVKRQNLTAWQVCASQQLFINTGAYLYQTPAGCADETIHFKNAAMANI